MMAVISFFKTLATADAAKTIPTLAMIAFATQSDLIFSTGPSWRRRSGRLVNALSTLAASSGSRFVHHHENGLTEALEAGLVSRLGTPSCQSCA